MKSGELAVDIHIDSESSSRGKEETEACHTREREEIEAMATTFGRQAEPVRLRVIRWVRQDTGHLLYFIPMENVVSMSRRVRGTGISHDGSPNLFLFFIRLVIGRT